MSVYLKNLSLERITNIIFCLFPLSFILGSLIIHLNLYLFLILSVIYIKKKNYKFNLSYTSNILICFFLFIIISSLINIESIKYDFFLKSILLFRFAILYLVLEVLLINNKINLKNFFISSLVCSSFVSFDIIFQYIFGHDLFGYGPDAGGRLTAVFGEERPNRYHAGLDIRTYGQVGNKLFATSNGYIKKISISTKGYGKAIYFQLDDGNIALYAHLSNFTREIDDIIRSLQKKHNKY